MQAYIQHHLHKTLSTKVYDVVDHRDYPDEPDMGAVYVIRTDNGAAVFSYRYEFDQNYATLTFQSPRTTSVLASLVIHYADTGTGLNLAREIILTLLTKTV